MNKVTRFTHL